MLSNIWAYRYFITNSITNELRARFAQSKLGGLWVVLNPLSQALIYALILSNVLSSKLPGIDSKYAYSVYLLSGLLCWNLFHELVSRCLTMFIDNGNLLKKIHFPKITLPIIAAGSSILNNIFLLLSILLILIVFNHAIYTSLLWLPLLIIITTVLALGVGILLSIFNVFLRDIGQITLIFLQMWFWFTPIVYPATILPETGKELMQLNPIYHLTQSYQQVIVYGQTPDLLTMLVILAASISILAFSFWLFRRASPEMVDVI